MSCCCSNTELDTSIKPKLRLNIQYPDARYGSNMPFLGSLTDTLRYTTTKCTQMFLGAIDKLECRTLTAVDKKSALEICQKCDKTFYVHCPLVANLAKTDCKRAVAIIQKEINMVSDLPGGCVLHIGRVGTIETVAQNLNALNIPRSSFDRMPYHLLLETAAGQGTELGRNWEEIRHLYEGLDTTKIGLCCDSQHLFSSAMCKFETHEDVVKLFDMAESILPKGISLMHLNDSTKPFGAHVDRHAPLTKGFIWGESNEGLKALISLSKNAGLDLVTETKSPFEDQAIIASILDSLEKT